MVARKVKGLLSKGYGWQRLVTSFKFDCIELDIYLHIGGC